MTDSATWLAVGLGVLAVAIAIWNEARDGFFLRRKRGVLEVITRSFDIPDPGILTQQIGRPPDVRQVRGTAIRVSIRMWNHLSWPVYVSLSVQSTLGPSGLLWLTTRDELLRDGDPSLLVPPRQPVERQLWLTIAEGATGEVSPKMYVGAGRRRSIDLGSKSLTWVEGRPHLGP